MRTSASISKTRSSKTIIKATDDATTTNSTKLETKRGSRRLLKISEVEEYLRSNPFILGGYRDKLSIPHCFLSILEVHNESLNIWTHLIGFLIFASLLIRDLLILPYNLVSFGDLCVLVGVLVSYQICMGLSALFHTFTCHSKQLSDTWLCGDLAGITLALLATYLSGIYYAFWCQVMWRDFYLVTVLGMFCVVSLMQLHPGFAADEFATLRTSLFTLWAIYGLVPTIHWAWLHGGFDHGLVFAMLPRIFTMYGICFCALIFYVTKLPERLWPGKVDIVGHSHQWWHVLICLALLFWHRTGLNFALFRLAHDCDSRDGEGVDQLALF